jgi:predicted Zn-dependent protease
MNLSALRTSAIFDRSAARLQSCGGLRLCLLISGILLLAGCTTVPITERRQLNLVSEGSLVGLGDQQYQEFLATHEIIRNTPQSEMVDKVGHRIRQAVEQFMISRNMGDQLAGYQWEFILVNSPEVNAWALPGGKVAVYTGILPITQDEAGLAAVMGHEVAHVVGKHGSERMSQQLVAQMGGQALSAVLADKPQATQALWMQVFGVGAQVGLMLPYSRLQEREADHLGLIFMAIAGYDPHAAIGVWQRMAEEKGGKGPPEFLSTHPADESRIRDIREDIPEAMRYYRPRAS